MMITETRTRFPVQARGAGKLLHSSFGKLRIEAKGGHRSSMP